MTHEEFKAQTNELINVVEEKKDYHYGQTLAQSILQNVVVEDNPELYATVLLYLSQCLWRSGLSQEGLIYAEQCLKIAITLNNKELQSRSFDTLGTLSSNVAEYVKALEYYHQSLTLNEELGNKERIASTKGNIGIVYTTLCDFSRALTYYAESLHLHQECNNIAGIAGNLHNIGNVYCNLSDYTSALEYYHKAHGFAQQIGSKSGEALCVGAIGNVYIHLKDYASALHYYHVSLKLAHDMNNKRSISVSLGNIGNVYLQLSRYDEALEYFQKALQLSEEISHKVGEALWKGNIGCVYLHKEYNGYDSLKGQEYVKESIEYFQKYSIKVHEYEMHKILAEFYEEECRWEEFAIHFKKYHDLKEDVNSEEVQRQLQNNEYQRIIAEKEKQLAVEKTRLEERDMAMKELEQINKKLIEADKAKNDIISIVAHDLKNPLTLIQLRADILQKINKNLTEEALITSAKSILSITQHMNNIITNLLDIHALETGKIPVRNIKTDIVPIIRNVVADNIAAASAKNMIIEVSIPSDTVWALADGLALYQILENLLSNAIKFSHQGLHVRVVCTIEDRHVSVSVRDFGPGISLDDQKKLFGKFQKLSARPTAGEYSTGLGLSIAKTIANLMDASLSCESVEGEGANFTIRLIKA